MISAEELDIFATQGAVTIDTPLTQNEIAAAAKAICDGLASGALTRDQVGIDLARLQSALGEVGESESANSYVKAFNSTTAAIKGCNVQVTGPSEDNLWNY